ncbi:MAG: hypothetical protein QXR87_04175 [Candidatus Hadarchaeales archaeon]
MDEKREVSRGKAIQMIYKETKGIYGEPKNLAKSVDEYNWIKAPQPS